MATPRARKTKLMRIVETKFQRPLEKLVPELVNERGLSGAAVELEVSPSTLNYWMLKLGIQVKTVALSSGETIEVRKPG